MPRTRIKLLCTLLALAWTCSAAGKASDADELVMAYGDKSFVTIATGTPVPVARAAAPEQ